MISSTPPSTSYLSLNCYFTRPRKFLGLSFLANLCVYFKCQIIFIGWVMKNYYPISPSHFFPKERSAPNSFTYCEKKPLLPSSIMTWTVLHAIFAWGIIYSALWRVRKQLSPCSPSMRIFLNWFTNSQWAPSPYDVFPTWYFSFQMLKGECLAWWLRHAWLPFLSLYSSSMVCRL